MHTNLEVLESPGQDTGEKRSVHKPASPNPQAGFLWLVLGFHPWGLLGATGSDVWRKQRAASMHPAPKHSSRVPWGQISRYLGARTSREPGSPGNSLALPAWASLLMRRTWKTWLPHSIHEYPISTGPQGSNSNDLFFSSSLVQC